MPASLQALSIWASMSGLPLIEPDDVHERSRQHPVDSGLCHRFPEDADICRGLGNHGACGAKIVEEFLERDRIGAGEYFAIVVSRDRDDLAGIFHIRPIKLVAIKLSLVVAVNDVS